MKRFFVMAAFAVAVSLSMTSCYSSKVYHGSVNEGAKLEKVHSKWNHFLLAGLIPINAKTKADDVMGGRVNYVVKTNHSFWNMFVTSLTAGIYSPTKTTFYEPKN